MNISTKARVDLGAGCVHGHPSERQQVQVDPGGDFAAGLYGQEHEDRMSTGDRPGARQTRLSGGSLSGGR